MKLSKNKLAVALGAVLSLGMAGQASADVYGVSNLAIDGLTITFSAGGGASHYTFSTTQSATLNGNTDNSLGGSASCSDLSPCADLVPGPRLSAAVRNAPGFTSAAVERQDNQYTKFGQTGEYSNAEAAIIRAELLGDGPSQTNAISESNLQSGTSAQAGTSVSSNTTLSLIFNVTNEASFNISFNAAIDVLAKATGVDFGNALAQANSGLTVTLQKGGVKYAVWAPNGTNGITTCKAGLTCSSTEAAGLSLQNSNTSDGAASSTVGSGSYELEVGNLDSGTYTLALNTTTSTDLARYPQVPVPGTLLLLGTGLLGLGRKLRRNK